MDGNSSSLFRRASRACTLGILGAALVAPSVAQASALPPSTTLTGTYALVHVDGRIGHLGADNFQQELRSGGRAYDVELHGDTAFRSGDSVRLTGRLQGSKLDVAHSAITAFAADNPAIGGTTRVLVVLADWTSADSVTPASAAAIFAQDNTWFQQTSYGQLSLATTVTNWVHVAAPAAGLCSDPNVSDSLTTRAVAASGYNANAFDRVVVYFPSSSDPSCTNVAGFAEAPGSHVWLNGTMDTRSTIHEQGHNYGLYHAHSALCTTPGTSTYTAAPDAAADNCTYSDYGDPFDAMGASSLVGEYSASQKDVLGWLDAGRKASLTPGATLNLVPYEQQSTAVHAAVFQASATRSYWFENRSATGPDANLPSGATSGVLVHVDDSTVDTASGEASPWAPAQTYLLDQSPDNWLGAAVLPYGRSWTSPEGVTFAIGAPSGGTVSVSAGGAPASAAAVVAPAPPVAAPVPVAQAPLASFLTAQLAGGMSGTTLVEGQAVVISGTALRADNTGADGATVEVQSSLHGQGLWSTVATLTVSGGGFLSSAVRPVGTSDLRLHIDASATEAGSTSNVLTLTVRPIVIAAVSSPLVRHGTSVGLDVSIPGHASQVVSVQRLVNGAWRAYATVRLGANGKRSVQVRMATRGRYEYRFFKAADPFHLDAFSKVLRVNVS